MRATAFLLLAAAALVVVACDLLGTGPPRSLEVGNGTNLAISVTVNGADIAIVAAETSRRLDAGELPHLPWRIEARTAGGRLVASLDVTDAAFVMTANSAAGAVALLDMLCGRLVIWAGAAPPSLPAPPPGPLVPCDP